MFDIAETVLSLSWDSKASKVSNEVNLSTGWSGGGWF
jgi:hypothetical protein